MRITNVSDRLVIVDRAVDVEIASKGLISSAPQDVYERWDEFVDWASSAVLPKGVHFDSRDASAPVPLPRQVFAIGLNYSEHAAEGGNDNPTFSLTFTKFPTSLTVAHAEVELPTEAVDWEAELVVVIGRRAHESRSATRGSTSPGLRWARISPSAPVSCARPFLSSHSGSRFRASLPLDRG